MKTLGPKRIFFIYLNIRKYTRKLLLNISCISQEKKFSQNRAFRINDVVHKSIAINIPININDYFCFGYSQNAIESNKNAYLYNSNSYSDCYQPQPHWQKSASSVSATRSSTTTHLPPKKQNLREFLSSWNEFEEEDVETTERRTSSQVQNTDEAHASTNKAIRFEKPNKSKESVPVIVQPTPQIVQPTPQMHPSYLQSALASSPYSTLPIANVPIVPPKIHDDITVDNGNQNLPDIIIDIEKTKGGGEGECFERTNGKENILFSLHFEFGKFNLQFN